MPLPRRKETKRPRKNPYRPLIVGLALLLTIALIAIARNPNTSPPPVSNGDGPDIEEPAPDPSDGDPIPDPDTPPGDEPEDPPGDEPEDPPITEPSVLLVHGDRSCKMIALTYDGGSAAEGAEAILDVLKKHNVKATMFFTGKFVENFPDLARRVVNEGHAIGNHSYSHPDLTTIPPEEALEQIRKAEEVIERVTGRNPRPLFREPNGAFNNAERLLVRQAGYTHSVYWDVDTLDWKYPSADELVYRMTEKAPSGAIVQNGSILLMHLNVPQTADATDRAIPILKAKGYQLVTIPELIQCSKQ